MAGSAFTVTPNTPQMRSTVSAIYDQIRNLVTDIEVLRVSTEASVVLVTELRTDHATTKTAVDELKTLTDELRADHATFITEETAIGTTLASVKTQFDAHTHTQQDGDSAQTSIPDDTAGGIATAGNDRTISDTSGSPPASITAGESTAGPATITAPAPSATATNAAGDMIASNLTLS